MKKIVSIVLALLSILFLISGCAGNETEKMATIDDIADKRIGVYTGTCYDKYVVDNYPQAAISRYNSISDFIEALKSGKVDAAIFSLNFAQSVIKDNPELGILSDDFVRFPVAVGFNKQNDALREKFNTYLAQIKQDGTLDAMYKKWYENDIEDVMMPEYAPNPEGKTIVLGVSLGDNLPSAAYVNGKCVGFDVEMLQSFAQKENYNLKIVTMEFSALVTALAAGKVDMIADGLVVTDEREKQVDFSDPYTEEISAVMVLRDRLDDSVQDSGSSMTMDEIAKKKVGVLQGSTHDAYMAKNYPDAQVLQYKSYPDLILAVKEGKVDAAFMTTEALYAKNDDSLRILADKVITSPIGMGFQKGSQLKEEFNRFLGEIKSNGVYDDWAKRWFEDRNYEMPAIDNKKDNGKLVVGIVSETGLPFTALKDNQLAGSDIELVERFGAYLGREVQFTEMDFSNLIAAASTGKVDMIASILMITEERAKQIDFSDPYYELSACVFGNAQNDGSSVPFFQSVADSFYNNIILENRYLLILDGLKTTGIISVFSILLGTALGALICFMRMAKKKAANITAKVYISIVRGIPVLVLLMVIFYVIFAKVDIAPVFVAVLAFGMNFAAYVAEMFRAAIESIDKGQTEAGIAGGFTKAKTFLYIVLPQAARQVLPVYQGELISLVKMTSIVGYIAVQDLTKASDIIRSRTFDAFFPLIMTAVLYFAISALLIWLLNMLQRRIDPKRKRKEAKKCKSA